MITIALWTAQILIAITLIWAAYMKAFARAKIAAAMPWTSEKPQLVVFTAIVDFLIALGLILPVALNIYPELTIFSAYGLATLMILATIFHLSRGEANKTPLNIIFFFLAIFIAWGWHKKLG